MARSDTSAGAGAAPRTDIRREPRPFLYLEPTQVGAVDPVGSDGLARALEPRVPHVVRANAGGGVTALSDPHLEWRESLAKMAGLERALQRSVEVPSEERP